MKRAAHKPVKSWRASENDEATTWIDWTRLVRLFGAPLFERVVHIPNERGKGGVATAILVGRLGMRKGFPDYQILCAVPPSLGLFIEAKRLDKKAREDQLRWQADLRAWGYAAEVCAGSLEMIAATRAYFAPLVPTSEAQRLYLQPPRFVAPRVDGEPTWILGAPPT